MECSVGSTQAPPGCPQFARNVQKRLTPYTIRCSRLQVYQGLAQDHPSFAKGTQYRRERSSGTIVQAAMKLRSCGLNFAD
jgi:hypothetical protein